MSVGAGIAVALAALVGLVGGFWISRRYPRPAGSSAARPTAAGLTVAETLSRTVALAPVGVVVVDKLRDVVVSNQRAAELGLVRDGLLDDRVWAAVQRTLADGADVEVDLSAPNGTTTGRRGLSVRVHVRLLSDVHPRFAVAYLHDQSEQARMEASRRDFVANVSHELKTPVAAMGVLAEALLESSDDPDTVRHFAGKLLTESQRLADMVGELIELSRLQGAERLPDLVSVDVDGVVQEAISRHKVMADNADITVSTDAPSGYRVLGDQALLVTAVANLISNAIAYSPNGSTVSISRRRRGDEIEIAVTDRGIGIAVADQQRVFERFFRVDQARSRATGGTGLGLAIVKHVAANHNGNIRLWSRPGTGSTFTLTIPVYNEEVA
ncbi:MAG: sensor histidine kinase [Mycobacterium sp.]|nr:sensor histidine kinase [Mycobacterium sp.]